MSKRKLFGEILIEAGALTAETLQKALLRQRGTGRRLGLILEEMGVISERDIALVLARQFHLKTVSNIAKHLFPQAVLALVDSDTALAKYIFPLKVTDKTLFVAMSNPLDMETIENLSFRTGLTVVPYVTTAAEIQAAIKAHYLKEERQGGSDWWSILVVEDAEMIRSAIVAALKKAGYEIREATNGAEGIKMAVQQPPHLIIADIMMPRMDGFEMFKALQANSATQRIPVIALSARSTPEEEARLLNAGFFDFIPKPINVVRLLARLKRALRHTYGQQDPSPR
jgi:CheY-like chemotaxis protein